MHVIYWILLCNLNIPHYKNGSIQTVIILLITNVIQLMTDMRQIQCFVMYHSYYRTCANCSVFCRSESFIIWFNSNSCCHHAWGTEKMTMTLNNSLTRSFDLLDETLWVWENFSKSWDSQALNSITKIYNGLVKYYSCRIHQNWSSKLSCGR